MEPIPRRRIAWIVGLLVAMGAFRLAHYAADAGPHFPAAYHLSAADDERIWNIMGEETRAVREHPEMRRRTREMLAAAGPGEDPFTLTRDAGAELATGGLWRLGTDDLRGWNRLRLLLTESQPVCVGIWNGVTPSADLFGAIAQLSDADIRSWARITGRAALLALDDRVGPGAPATPLSDDAEFGLALDTLSATLPEADLLAFDEDLTASETDELAGCRWIRRVMTLAAGSSSGESDTVLRYLAAPPPG